MTRLLDLAWLVPLLPISSSVLVLTLLYSFSRTMNRLTKPVSYFLILATIISTVLSFFLYYYHVSGEVIYWHFSFGGMELDPAIFIDSLSTILSTILGISVFILLVFSLYSLDRRIGYVLYVSIITLTLGCLDYFAFSGRPFHSVVKVLASLISRDVYS